MENGGDRGGGRGGGGGGGSFSYKISSDDVISKLKDDGDFDRLRLKIIRKLKENEELRNSIASIVKQSAALNRPGAENMKPRQLSDAIHQEVGGKLNDRISDGLWEIIRSGDGMKTEIRETVKSVYDSLTIPKGDENVDPSHCDAKRTCTEPDLHKSKTAPADVSDTEPQEPPGFSQADSCHIDIRPEPPKAAAQPPLPPHSPPTGEPPKETLHQLSQNDTLEPGSPPGFSSGVDHEPPGDGSDDELDAPPGFG